MTLTEGYSAQKGHDNGSIHSCYTSIYLNLWIRHLQHVHHLPSKRLLQLLPIPATHQFPALHRPTFRNPQHQTFKRVTYGINSSLFHNFPCASGPNTVALTTVRLPASVLRASRPSTTHNPFHSIQPSYWRPRTKTQNPGQQDLTTTCPFPPGDVASAASSCATYMKNGVEILYCH